MRGARVGLEGPTLKLSHAGEEGVQTMAKGTSSNGGRTGKSAATAASKILSNPKSTPAEKKVAASDLSQRRGK